MKIDLTLKPKPGQPLPDRTARVIANSIYKTLRDEGCQDKDIISVSTQLIGLVTAALEERGKAEAHQQQASPSL